jgi:hypothetical protein
MTEHLISDGIRQIWLFGGPDPVQRNNGRKLAINKYGALRLWFFPNQPYSLSLGYGIFLPEEFFLTFP